MWVEKGACEPTQNKEAVLWAEPPASQTSEGQVIRNC